MNKLCKTLLGILVLSALLVSGCAKNSTGRPAESSAGSEMGSGFSPEEPAASITFAGTDLEGHAVTSDVFTQSKLTMVNVWATYCSPCLSEMPYLGELAAEYDTEEFQIIGIVSDVLEGHDLSVAEGLVQETGANYTHLLLNESIYDGLLMDVSAVPTTFFLDSNGTILDTVIGAMKKSAWEDKINGLLEAL